MIPAFAKKAFIAQDVVEAFERLLAADDEIERVLHLHISSQRKEARIEKINRQRAIDAANLAKVVIYMK